MREALLKGRNLGFHICIQSVTTHHSSETYEEAPPSQRYILGKGRVSWTSLMGPGYLYRSLDHTLRTTGNRTKRVNIISKFSTLCSHAY